MSKLCGRTAAVVGHLAGLGDLRDVAVMSSKDNLVRTCRIEKSTDPIRILNW